MAASFTPEEIQRYATFHWRMVDDNTAHVWRSIGGMSTYLGTTDDIKACRRPAEQRPLIPSLDRRGSFGSGGAPTGAA